MIYLASPYSHPDLEVRKVRYKSACRATAWLMAAFDGVFSPIVHSYHLVEHGCPDTLDFWLAQDVPMLRKCDSLYVLCIDGWRESLGVSTEIHIARACRMTIRYLTCEYPGQWKIHEKQPVD